MIQSLDTELDFLKKENSFYLFLIIETAPTLEIEQNEIFPQRDQLQNENEKITIEKSATATKRRNYSTRKSIAKKKKKKI
jgi:hypothetical protein